MDILGGKKLFYPLPPHKVTLDPRVTDSNHDDERCSYRKKNKFRHFAIFLEGGVKSKKFRMPKFLRENRMKIAAEGERGHRSQGCHSPMKFYIMNAFGLMGK